MPIPGTKEHQVFGVYGGGVILLRHQYCLLPYYNNSGTTAEQQQPVCGRPPCAAAATEHSAALFSHCCPCVRSLLHYLIVGWLRRVRVKNTSAYDSSISRRHVVKCPLGWEIRVLKIDKATRTRVVCRFDRYFCFSEKEKIYDLFVRLIFRT